jgi:hypothetical protein
LNKSMGLVIVSTLIVLVSIMGVTLPVLANNKNTNIYRGYIIYEEKGSYIQISNNGRPLTYKSYTIVKYDLKGIRNNTLFLDYVIQDTNDTKGIFSPGVDEIGKIANGNISANVSFNYRLFTIYLDPSSLNGDGHVHYTNITNSKDYESSYTVDGYYDPTTGLLINYTLHADKNSTVGAGRASFTVTYRILNSNIPAMQKYVSHSSRETTTTLQPGRTSSSNKGGRTSTLPYALSRSSDYLYYSVIIVSGFLATILVLVVIHRVGRH